MARDALDLSWSINSGQDVSTTPSYNARKINKTSHDAQSQLKSWRPGERVSIGSNPSAASAHRTTWHPSRGIVFQQSSKAVSHTAVPGLASNKQIVVDAKPDEHAPFDLELCVDANVPEVAEADIIAEVVVDPAYEKLPESPTSFGMTEELFRAAKAADPNSIDSFFSHELYRGPLGKRVTIHYCKSALTTERVLETYFMDENVIGFDIEWQPNASRHMGARSNVSLVQIASVERIALFHLSLYPKGDTKLVSPLFKEIMENPSVTKVGCTIKADCTRLRKYLNIDSQGLFELSHLYKLVRYSTSKDYKRINKALVSLAAQVQEHLHLPLFKGSDVRGSNWAQKLGMDQIQYAAKDSYAAVQLYHTMELKRKLLDPTPPRPSHAELNLPIQVAEVVKYDLEDDVEGA